MAYDYTFGPGPALDPNLDLVPSASGEVYDQESGGDPLTVLVNGVPTTVVESDANGLLQSFAADYARVWVDLGTGRFRLNSFDGAIEQVEQALAAAQAAAADAELAAGQVLPVGGSAGMVLAKRTSADRDVMWVLQSGGGGGGGGSVMVWRYQGGGYPDLTPTRPDGVITVEAQGPSQPTNVPDWVGLSPSQATLLYTFVPLS